MRKHVCMVVGIVVVTMYSNYKAYCDIVDSTCSEQRMELKNQVGWDQIEELKVPENWNSSAWYRVPAADIDYIVDDGIDIDNSKKISDFIILIDKNSEAEEIVQFAAEQLQRYLYAITGSYIVIAAGNEEVHAPYVIEISRFADKNVDNCSEDEFVIKSLGKKLILAGASSRACLYAVYTFLEKYLGCRWYYINPGDQIIPQKEISELKKIIENGMNDYQKPDFPYREMMVFSADEYWTVDRRKDVDMFDFTDDPRSEMIKKMRYNVYWFDWMAKNRMNVAVLEATNADCFLIEQWDIVKSVFKEAKKRGIDIGLGGHAWVPFMNENTPGWPKDDSWGALKADKKSVSIMVDEKRNANNEQIQKKHVKMVCGDRLANFCTTNREALKTFLWEIVSFFRSNPEITIWAAWPPDGSNGWCECDICSKFSPSYRCVKIHNQIARALELESERDYSPLYGKKLKVNMLAYDDYRTPPRESLSLHPAVSIVPDIYSNFSASLGEKSSDEGFRLWQDYIYNNGSSANALYLFTRWNRTIWTGYYLMPPSAISGSTKYMYESGFKGLESFHGYGGWWNKGVNATLTAKTLWSSTMDYNDFMDEYFCLYYGPAAKSVFEIYQAIDSTKASSARYFQYGLGAFDYLWKRYGMADPCDVIPESLLNSDFLKYPEKTLCVACEVEKLLDATYDNLRVIKAAEVYANRVNKIKISWNYYKTTLLNYKYNISGVKFMEQALYEADKEKLLACLDQAEDNFKKAKGYYGKTTNYISEYGGLMKSEQELGAGILWDGGHYIIPRIDTSEWWLKKISEIRKKVRTQKGAELAIEKTWKISYSVFGKSN